MNRRFRRSIDSHAGRRPEDHGRREKHHRTIIGLTQEWEGDPRHPRGPEQVHRHFLAHRGVGRRLKCLATEHARGVD